MDEEQFWMVWSPQGRAPTKVHQTLGSATNEAERLARNNPGNQFYVLQALEMREVNDMRRVRLSMPVPF